MTSPKLLKKLQFLAAKFVHDRADAAQAAAEIGPLVAALDGVLHDDGKAIAFATAALLAAGCAGMREHCLGVLNSEITSAFRATGRWS